MSDIHRRRDGPRRLKAVLAGCRSNGKSRRTVRVSPIGVVGRSVDALTATG